MSNRHFTLIQVEVIGPCRLRLAFADGAQLEVELSDIVRRYPTLTALTDPAVFATAAPGEWGGSVVWNGDDNLELAADNLRARAVEQAGGYSHELIWNWMARHGLTLDSAAEALGLSRRMLAYYRSGAKPVPRTVALALRGWEAEQQAA
ncbi:DUF2442 domain-containing protein [Azotobacter beijerinckii]|uniref:DUF2442 domain-containing protein n=1 Tax=Azotobacter beijerinckii TaxID=170623 RepID=A0A1H9NL53_9GAMM|nr:DUF2442 domain-containing protein [Azotobacter beijerinckii]MDV7212121.1 DUF2442 domain-containing protein [Azotobacter beijerinckii]SER36385.1 Protein of unknown function [Azotobacter beijerinckii]